MPRVLALVEGQTEQAFVKGVLAPELGAKNVFLTAALLGKPGRRRGGIRSWRTARTDVLAALKQDPKRSCTTMFDYYAMPRDWPGRTKSAGLPASDAAETVELALHEDIRDELGPSFDARRFVPYVQMHEFEALLFSGPLELADIVANKAAASEFHRALTSCGSPEEIDDSPQTAPSKRIIALAPHYDKVVHGGAAAQRIGLARMRHACPHFNEWLTRLEDLGSPSEAATAG